MLKPGARLGGQPDRLPLTKQQVFRRNDGVPRPPPPDDRRKVLSLFSAYGGPGELRREGIVPNPRLADLPRRSFRSSPVRSTKECPRCRVLTGLPLKNDRTSPRSASACGRRSSAAACGASDPARPFASGRERCRRVGANSAHRTDTRLGVVHVAESERDTPAPLPPMACVMSPDRLTPRHDLFSSCGPPRSVVGRDAVDERDLLRLSRCVRQRPWDRWCRRMRGILLWWHVRMSRGSEEARAPDATPRELRAGPRTVL